MLSKLSLKIGLCIILLGFGNFVLAEDISEVKSASKVEAQNDKSMNAEIKNAKNQKTKKSTISESKKEGSKMHNIVIDTSLGKIEVELNGEKAPITVDNFLKYVDKKHYDGTIFHRVIGSFMIQGGGYKEDMSEKQTEEPIKNEADNGLKNDRGTLAMARTQIVDSATAQFFINVVDNPFLNFKSPDPRGYGYAVFGKVTSGMDVVDKIKAVPTGVKKGMDDVPETPVTIKSIRRK